MIVKKIDRAAAEGFGDRARSVALLVDYMRMPEKDSTFAEALRIYLEEEGAPVRGIERLYHLGATNFLSELIEGQRAEMMAVANAATRSPNPLDHWLLSWKENEHPTHDQIDEAASIFLTHLGLARHQAIYAAHADTHNVHVHIAVNRYDPVRDRMAQVNRGRDWLTGHQAIALIVDAQNWGPEDRALYRVQGGQLTARPDHDQDGVPTINANALSFEVRTGLKSTQRIAIEEANPVMLQARSWHELHYGLAQAGIEIVPQSGGAVLRIGQTHVKASSAHKQCSFDKLQQRLGPFKSRLPSVLPGKRAEERDVMPEAIGALDFRREREAAKVTKANEIRAVMEAKDAAIRRASEEALRDFDALKGLDDGGRSPERSALKSVIKEKKRIAEAEAKAVAKAAIKLINEQYRLSADYERWLREQNADYLADRWRNRNRLSKWITSFDGKGDHFYHLQEMDGFEVRELGGVRLWARHDQRIAFVEQKDCIEVAMRKDSEAILAAFAIAASKFGLVTVNGSSEFKIHAASVIATTTFAGLVANPELQQTLRRHKTPSPLNRTDLHQMGNDRNACSVPQGNEDDISRNLGVQKAQQERGNGR